MKQIILCLCWIFSNAAQSQPSQSLKWLTGKWQITRGPVQILEQWQISGDSSLTGKSLLIKNGKDTIPQETVRIVFEKGGAFYIPTVNGQNNNQPVRFKMIFLGATEFICQDLQHDFPQRIAYRLQNHQLLASIEGNQNGVYHKENFDFDSR